MSAKKTNPPARGAFLSTLEGEPKKDQPKAEPQAPAAVPPAPEPQAPAPVMYGTGRVRLNGEFEQPPEIFPVALRPPLKLVQAFDAHITGKRGPTILALMAEAVERAQAGENVDLDAAKYAKWFQ